MNSRSYIRVAVFIFGLSAVIFPRSARAEMLRQEGISPKKAASTQDAAPKFVPGQLIVKLKDGRTIQDVQDLNSKYGVKNTDTVFGKTPLPEEKLQALRDKLAGYETGAHASWYWQMDANSQEYKDYSAKIEKEKALLQKEIRAQEALLERLAQRKARAGANTPAPGLENVYILSGAASSDIRAMVAEYSSHPAVAYAEPNYLAQISFVPSDPQYTQQWAHQKTKAETAWDITRGRQDVIVAVIDTGAAYDHEDLAENIWRAPSGAPGKDFVNMDTASLIEAGFTLVDGEDYTGEDDDPADFNGHGTHCAGIVAADENNGVGVAGICPDCSVMPLRAGFSIYHPFYGNTGLLDTMAVVRSIEYADANGAHVISMSFGGSFASETEKLALDAAYANGMILIAAAGNSNSSSESYPAAFDSVLSVAATDQNDNRASFSNYGDWVDVSAPGVAILSTVPTQATLGNASGYASLSGTSMACPYVAGLAGLVLSTDPQLSRDAVRDRLIYSSDDLGNAGKDDSFGWGRVNAHWAVRLGGSNIGIDAPAHNGFVRGAFEIRGSAFTESGFQRYELLLAPEDQPQNITTIASSTATVRNGRLGTFDSRTIGDKKYILTLKVSLTDGKIIRIPVPVTVDNVSEPPVLMPRKNQGVVVGKPFTFTLEATDPDDPAFPVTGPWGKLSCSAQNLPAGATFDEETQTLSWTPSESERGNFATTFTVRDNEHTTTQTVTFSTVTLKNLFHAPTATWNRLSRNALVWTDERDQIWRLFCYDFATQQERQLTDGTDDFITGLHEDTAVFISRIRNAQGEWEGNDVSVVDVPSGAVRKLTHDAAYQQDAAIHAGTVVWSDYRYNNINGEIFSYDLGSSAETRLTETAAGESMPLIDAHRIAWAEYANNYCDIYVRERSGGQAVKLPIQDRPLYSYYSNIFAMDDGRVAWIGVKDQKQDLRIHDVATGETEQVTDDGSEKFFVAIEGDKVLWTDSRHVIPDAFYTNFDIYLYDLQTGTETRLTDTPGQEQMSSIHGDKISWCEFGSGVYLAQIFFAPQITTVSPAQADRGAMVTVNGKNFGDERTDESAVRLSGADLRIVSWSNTQITCTVPEDAESGELWVATPGGESNRVTLTIGGGGLNLGDVSGDGKVSAYDAALAAQFAVELITLSPDQQDRAEVSGDGRVSSYDAALIARYSVGLISEFPR